MPMSRCRKCGIAGDDADIDRHEPLCIAVPCKRCKGRGYTFRNGCIWPTRFQCNACDHTGVTGGIVAKAKAQDQARQWYNENVFSR